MSWRIYELCEPTKSLRMYLQSLVHSHKEEQGEELDEKDVDERE
jgi:hypothetical protein